MTLKIKTPDIELEYTDEYKIIEAQAKIHILEIINQIYSYRVIHLDKPPPHIRAEEVFGKIK
jgi:hypothetical protein